MDIQRQVVYYSGRVQGVGFRATTRAVARDFQVTGTVQNLFDGRVRVVAEGSPAELHAFFATVRSRLERYIQNEQSDPAPATGEFDGFEIAY